MDPQNLPDSLAVAARLADIDQRLARGDARMASIESDLSANTAITREIRDLMDAARLGLRMLGGLGQVAKWSGMVATAAVAIYTAVYMLLHGGQPPTK
jgi:hypothetical protein